MLTSSVKNTIAVAAFVAMLSLSAIGSSAFAQDLRLSAQDSSQPVPALETPAATATSPHFGTSSFVLAAGDLLRVRVWPDSLLGGDFPIEDSGIVHLPLLGAIAAAGKPVRELREELRSGYARDLRLPVVSVTPRFRVSVLGAVRSPGVYWIDPAYGLFELISQAGGAVDGAKLDRVEIDRGGTVIDAHLDRGVQRGEELDLRSGDRVFVPRSRGFPWTGVVQGLTLVVSVAGLVLR